MGESFFELWFGVWWNKRFTQLTLTLVREKHPHQILKIDLDKYSYFGTHKKFIWSKKTYTNSDTQTGKMLLSIR